ncbi:MAG: hypothetical protein ACRC0A_02715 [Chitinophagaceae bacterium]
MNKKIKFIYYCCGLLSTSVFSQTPTATVQLQKNDSVVVKKNSLMNALQKVTIYGFVRTDVFYNSRQNIDVRDGALSVYPLPPLISNGEDLRKQPQLGFTAIVSRLGVRFDQAHALGANVSGLLETDFFGITNNTIFSPSGTSNSTVITGTQNLLRLRHAYVKLDWNKVNLLLGQYWNPNFIAKCFPGVANFNTGIPFNPFGFLPQAKVEYNFAKGFTLTAMAFGFSLSGFSPSTPSIDNSDIGVGFTDNNILSGMDAQRFSSIPSFSIQLAFENEYWLFGIGAESNTLRPHTLDRYDRNTNQWGVAEAPLSKVKNTFTAFNGLTYLKYSSQPITAKLYANFGQSYTQYVGLGGFSTYRSVENGSFVYRPQNQLNLWTEISITKYAMFQPALFVGYDRNMGLATKINANDVQGGLTPSTVGFTGRAIGIAANSTYQDFVRVAPRLDILSGKLKFSIEYEWNHMIWGNPDIATFKVQQGTQKAVDNNRILFIAVYSF